MLYEKEVAELWKEWKKSTEKYEEAIEDGYDVDADMWANDVGTIHRQIHLYEQAAKADEYEAKAEAYDDIRYAMEMQTAIGVSDEDTLIDIEHVIVRLIERMKGGGSDD